MSFVEDHQRRAPKVARQMNQRLEKEFYEPAAFGELELVEIDHRRSGRLGDRSPRLPQIRTCRFPASGSSVHGFAT
jgi:hypothetical protein